MVVSTVTTTSWFTGQNTNPEALMRLFCFPYAGGGSLIYRHWTKFLPPTIEIVRVQLPGRESRLKEPPFTRVEPLISELADAIQLYRDKPFAFFGHSMGGLISFELTRRLHNRPGLLPAHLFISGYTAPNQPDTSRRIYDLPEPEFIEEIRNFNGTPDEVLEHPELMRLMLPLIRADFEVCQTYDYVPGPPFHCPITVFGGREDKTANRSKLEAWREYTTGRFSLHMLPGDHFFLNTSQSVLLQLISRNLQNSRRKAFQL
jgi:medium-chain acyl-[acyl-carrier-protein] hydrolase